MQIKFNIKPDVPNANGVIYPKEVIEKAFNAYKEKEYRLGTLKYGSTNKLQLSDVAFEVKSINKKEDTFMGDIEILDTPAGKELKNKILNEIPDKFRLCTMMICDTDIAPNVNPYDMDYNKQNILIVKNASIEYVVLYPKEDCA